MVNELKAVSGVLLIFGQLVFSFPLAIADVRKLQVLQRLKCSFDVANDGIEAVRMFKECKYDAVLMDENMPNMSGIEATKEILKIEKKENLKHTPIIALTANAVKGDRERFINAGMDEYLTKPLKKENLVNVLYLFLGEIDENS